MILKEGELTHSLFLAGGEGRRIQEVVSKEKLPKQLLEVGGTSSLNEGLRVVKQEFPTVKIMVISSPYWYAEFVKVVGNSGVVLVQEASYGNADAIRTALSEINKSGEILCCNADNLFGLEAEELWGLVKTHRENGNETTVLLEEESWLERAYVWLYNKKNELLGRVRRQRFWESDLFCREGVKKGFFCGIFIARFEWLREASLKECQLAMKEGREAKITKMILRGVSEHQKIGVYPTGVIHYGINTPEELFFLRDGGFLKSD
jgi:NDP-sugar pyrophosphorylase family protein